MRGISIGELLMDGTEQERRAMEDVANNLRVAMPGYIVSFDATNQTATVQTTLKERLDGELTQLPQLLDVPVQFPRAGGFCLTFPVKSGDECLVVFGDGCIDAWWQSGGIQEQIEMRRHDLSDAMAIMGISSVPKAISNFSVETTQYRNESGDTFIEIAPDGTITIRAKKLIFDIKDTVETTAGEGIFESTGGDISESAGGNVTIKGSKINLN
jgi:hypothetical protein